MAVVKQIKITRLTDKEWYDISDCHITRQNHAVHSTNSIYDGRMGTCDRDILCETCQNNVTLCIGGFGTINLLVPYFFPENSKYIIFLVSLVCSNCSNILITHDEYKLFDSKFRKKLFKIKDPLKIFNSKWLNNKICSNCGGTNLSIVEEFLSIKNNQLPIPIFINVKTKTAVDLDIIKNILDKIDVEQLNKIEININPGTLLNSYLPVIPICLRPPTQFITQHGFSDLSTLYNALVKDITKFSNIKTSNSKSLLIRTVYERVEMIQTNRKNRPLPNLPRAPQSIQKRIEEKNGRVNQNINGKRVNYSGRAVVGGYPNGKFGYVEVPKSMAEEMTVPYFISNLDNIEEWIKIYKPLRVIKTNGNVYWFKFIKPKFLQIGDILERPLCNDDIILFNRQPTLRIESIMPMRIRIVNCNTFRLNLAFTTAYNADFDGDEMNMHVLQDQIATVECLELMDPKELIISSQNGDPIICPVQDALLGLYLLSTSINVTLYNIYDILVEINMSYNFFRKKVTEWNKLTKTSSIYILNSNNLVDSRLTLSLLFSSLFSYNDNKINIVNGCIISGILTKKSVKGIIHKYYFFIGKQETADLIDRIHSITNYVLAIKGFSLGLQDCYIDVDLNEDYFIDIDRVLLTLETVCLNNIPDSNSFLNIIKSGAKGSLTNIVQVSLCVGQQSIDGDKVPKEMRSDRTLTYFDKNDNSYESRGFVRNSFSKGLSKSEMFFHCKAGRKGVTDSVIKVADTGYINKKIDKFMEDFVIAWDGSVRNNTNNKIVQFLFGSDGCNPQRIPIENGKRVLISSMDIENYNLNISKNNIQEILNNVSIYCKRTTDIIRNLKKSIIDERINFNVEPALPLTTSLDPAKLSTTPNNFITCSIEALFFQRFIQPGTAIGLICGINFCEVASQLLLKSFHHTGIKNKDITGGSKRLNQLLCRNLPLKIQDNIVFIRFKNDIIDNYCEWYKQIKLDTEYDSLVSKTEGCIILKTIIEDLGERLILETKMIIFNDIIDNVEFYSSCISDSIFVNYSDSLNQLILQTIYNNKLFNTSSYYYILYTLNLFKITQYTLSINTIIKILSKKFNVIIISENKIVIMIPKMKNKKSDQIVDSIDDQNKIYNTSNVKISEEITILRGGSNEVVSGKAGSNEVVSGKAGSNEVVISEAGSDPSVNNSVGSLFTSDNHIENISEINSLLVFPHFNKIIKETIIRNGLKFISFELELNNNVCLEAIIKGVYLKDIIQLDFIDIEHTRSMDPIENAEIFGIESGRINLFKCIQNVLSFDGTSNVDLRYISLISDVITRDGAFKAILSKNITKESNGILCSALFEKIVKRLNEYSVYSEVDNCRSLESSIFLGQIGKLGTGYCTLFDIYKKEILL